MSKLKKLFTFALVGVMLLGGAMCFAGCKKKDDDKEAIATVEAVIENAEKAIENSTFNEEYLECAEGCVGSLKYVFGHYKIVNKEFSGNLGGDEFKCKITVEDARIILATHFMKEDDDPDSYDVYVFYFNTNKEIEQILYYLVEGTYYESYSKFLFIDSELSYFESCDRDDENPSQTGIENSHVAYCEIDGQVTSKIFSELSAKEQDDIMENISMLKGLFIK